MRHLKNMLYNNTNNKICTSDRSDYEPVEINFKSVQQTHNYINIHFNNFIISLRFLFCTKLIYQNLYYKLYSLFLLSKT